MLLTIATAQASTDVRVLEHLDAEAAIPVVSDRPALQGDVSVLPTPDANPAVTPMPARVDVVRGEAGGNTHSLHPMHGACMWDAHTPSGMSDLALGTLTVPLGSSALLAHPEHGFLQFAPGTYRIGRQREYAGEWAYVAD